LLFFNIYIANTGHFTGLISGIILTIVTGFFDFIWVALSNQKMQRAGVKLSGFQNE